MNRNTFLKRIGVLSVLPLLGFDIPKSVAKNKVIEFTPEIIKKYNFGLYLINDKADVVRNPNYAATVAWKLCWTNDRKPKDIPTEEEKKHLVRYNRYCKVNFLTDGWICPVGNSYEEVCEYLNNNPHGEKYRIMTKDELFYIINNRTNQKQLFYE